MSYGGGSIPSAFVPRTVSGCVGTGCGKRGAIGVRHGHGKCRLALRGKLRMSFSRFKKFLGLDSWGEFFLW